MADKVNNIPSEVYEAHHLRLEVPPIWFDIIFMFIISIIHISYSFKFTKFSLAYLNAKCEEKKSGIRYTTSELYLKAVKSDIINPNLDDADYMIYTLWTQLSVVRNILRIIMCLACFVVLILWIVLQCNIIFEYLITCIVYYEKGSYLALLVLPALIFVEMAIIRYIFFGIMVSWSINVDNIADVIAEEAQRKKGKIFAFKHTKTSDPKTPIESPWNADKKEDEDESRVFDLELNEEPDNIGKPRKSVLRRYSSAMLSFTGSYWMAVHWRLLTVSCCIIATIIALPTISLKEAELKDSFWIQLFLRYLCFAAASWIIIYFVLSLCIGLYARISNLTVYNEIMNNTENNMNSGTRLHRLCTCSNFLRLFCLMDAFGLQDTNKVWSKCKFVLLTILFSSGIICICVGSIIASKYNGMIWFIGVVHIFYYGANIILTVKPRGIYHLWRADMNALEMNMDDDGIGDRSIETYVNSSHAANMVHHLSIHEIRRLLSAPMSQDVIMHDFGDEDNEDNEEEDNYQIISVMSERDRMLVNENENEEKKDEHILSPRSETPHNEKDVISLFNQLFLKVNNKRKRSVEERSSAINICVRSVINLYCTLKLYKGYWLLILPYNYNLRPLSVLPNGRSITETVIKSNYKQNSLRKSLKKCCKFWWNACKGMLCFIALILILLSALYLSVEINKNVTDNTDSMYNSQSIVENNKNSSTSSSSYPICDLSWNGNLSVIDLTTLSLMSYDITFADNMQPTICSYFDRKQSISNCSWKLIYNRTQEPVFMHLRHDMNKTDVIVIRGTKSNLDFIQDINLFGSVFLLQTASWIIPITSIFPTSFIVRIVYFMSYFEGYIDGELRERYDFPVFQYSYNLLINSKYKINSLYFIGHSIGGGISQAVAGQLNHLYEADWINQHALNPNFISNLEIKSYSIATPGMVFSSKKFSINLHDLYVTATILKPKADIVSNIDLQGGMVQNQECDESKFISCHPIEANLCRLVQDCNIYHSHNPDLIHIGCQWWLTNGGLLSFRKFLNQSVV